MRRAEGRGEGRGGEMEAEGRGGDYRGGEGLERRRGD